VLGFGVGAYSLSHGLTFVSLPTGGIPAVVIVDVDVDFVLESRSSISALSRGSKPLRWAGIVVVGVPAPHGSPLSWTLWWGFPGRIVTPKPTLGSPRPNVVRYTGVGWRVGQLDGRKEGRKKTNHDESRGSLSGRT